jgi:hypothetical protein
MTNDRSTWLWTLCVLFGVGVIAFAVWFGGVIPTRTCTGTLPAGVSALLAYQLSRTPADIEAVFGPAGEPCRAAMIAALDRANTVDLVGFIATYGAFLAFFFLALMRAGTGLLASIGFVGVVVALGFDVIETWTQLRITAELPGSAASLALLAVGSTGKFLALVSVCAGLAMFARGKIVARIAGAACIAGSVMAVVGLASASARSALSVGAALSWVVMLLYAVTAAVRRGVTKMRSTDTP